MNRELSIHKSIKFNAEKSIVWDALVNPNIIKEYLFGTEVISEWKAGSAMIFQGEWEGQKYKDKGNIFAIEPEKLFQYNYWSRFSGLEDKEDNYSLITYLVEEENGQTILTLTQQGFANDQAKEHSDVSWSMILEKMKELIENESTQ